jgi:hypothetical protein
MLPELSTAQGPMPSASTAIGSKFQVLLEEEVEYTETSPYLPGQKQTYARQSVVGEVQVFVDDGSMGPTPRDHPRLLIKGFGHGTHETRISSSECTVDASGPFNVIFLGSIYDSVYDVGNTAVEVGAYPISVADMSEKTLESVDLAQIMTNTGGGEQYTATTPFNCQGVEGTHTSTPSSIKPSFSNITQTYLKEGSINAEEITPMPEYSGNAKFKMVLSPPALKYDIFGTVKVAVKDGYPISNSKVAIVDMEELKKKLGKNYSPSTPLKLSDLQLPFEQKTATSDDKNAKYSFTVDGKGKVLPTLFVVSLLWYDKEKGGGGEFAVTTGPEKGGNKIPIYMISCVGNLYPGVCAPWKPNKAKDGFEAELNFIYGDLEHQDMENEALNPRSPPMTVVQYDGAYTYYNSYKAIKYFESLKGKVSMTLNPVIIDVYNSIHEGCLDEKTKVDLDSAFYENTLDFKTNNFGGLGTYLEPVKASGGTVTICRLISAWSYPGAPDMREYHELGHYLQTVMYSKSPLQPNRGVPHAGYENSGTNDSLGEGFATFVTLLINEHYKVGTPKTQSTYRLGETRIDVEKDYMVWGDHVQIVKDANGKIKVLEVNYNGPPDQEERAVNGILWDLHDKTSDRRSQLSTLYKTSVDTLSLPDWQILKIISDNDPMNLVELHDNFVANLPPDKVDMIFINHGAFADNLIRNLIQEVPAELPGLTGDTRTVPDRHNRMNEPLVPGSYIVAQNDATFNISMIHDPPYSDYNFSYLVNMTKDKPAYFEMSPSYYPSKAVFDQVTMNGSAALVKNAITIGSNEYWDYISSNPKNNQVFKTIPSIVDTTQQKTYDIHEDPRFNGNITSTNNTSFGIQQNNNISSSSRTSLNSTVPLTLANNLSSTSANQVNPLQSTAENSTSPIPVPLPSSNDLTNLTNITAPSANSTIVTIDLLPNSLPLSYKCNQTTVNSSTALPGPNITGSLFQALTDGNLDTGILGNVTLDIDFQTPITDQPGFDLVIYEVGQNVVSFRPIMLMVYINGTEYSHGYLIEYQTFENDSCGNPINYVQLDFEQFGIMPGDTIADITIRIDNDYHKNGGVGIRDITTLNGRTNQDLFW